MRQGFLPKDRTGQKFGKLLFIEKTNKRDNGGSIIWIAQCDCGKLCKVSAKTLCAARAYEPNCGCVILDRKNNVATHEHKMFRNSKASAARLGLAFNLEESDIIIPNVCPILGITLQPNKGIPQDNSPSVDRLAPNLGYVKGNIRVISFKANKMKNCLTRDDLLKLLAYVDGQL